MRKLLFLFAISIILFAVGCTEQGCESIKDANSRDACLFDRAASSLASEECNKIQSDVMKNSCFAEIAIKKDDLPACDSISSKSKDYCRAKIALARNSILLCNDIETPYWSDICHKDLSILNNDSTECVSVINLFERDICYDKIARNTLTANYCSYIKNDTTHDKCFTKIAVDTLNESLCGKTRNQSRTQSFVYADHSSPAKTRYGNKNTEL